MWLWKNKGHSEPIFIFSVSLPDILACRLCRATSNLRLVAIRAISVAQSPFWRNIPPTIYLRSPSCNALPVAKLLNFALLCGSWKLYTLEVVVFLKKARNRIVRGRKFSFAEREKWYPLNFFMYQTAIVDEIVAHDPSPSKFTIRGDRNILIKISLRACEGIWPYLPSIILFRLFWIVMLDSVFSVSVLGNNTFTPTISPTSWMVWAVPWRIQSVVR